MSDKDYEETNTSEEIQANVTLAFGRLHCCRSHQIPLILRIRKCNFATMLITAPVSVAGWPNGQSWSHAGVLRSADAWIAHFVSAA